MLAATYRIDTIYDSTAVSYIYSTLSPISGHILFNVLAGALCVNLTFLGMGDGNRNGQQHSAARQTRLVAVKSKNYNHIKSVGTGHWPLTLLLPCLLRILLLHPFSSCPVLASASSAAHHHRLGQD